MYVCLSVCVSFIFTKGYKISENYEANNSYYLRLYHLLDTEETNCKCYSWLVQLADDLWNQIAFV